VGVFCLVSSRASSRDIVCDSGERRTTKVALALSNEIGVS